MSIIETGLARPCKDHLVKENVLKQISFMCQRLKPVSMILLESNLILVVMVKCEIPEDIVVVNLKTESTLEDIGKFFVVRLWSRKNRFN